MNKPRYYVLFLLLAATLAFAACGSSGRVKKGCGCGAHKGYVGY